MFGGPRAACFHKAAGWKGSQGEKLKHKALHSHMMSKVISHWALQPQPAAVSSRGSMKTLLGKLNVKPGVGKGHSRFPKWAEEPSTVKP